ncbi:hypothetical protein K6U20_11545 [Vibrio fluvialis]|uniref:hypothetical protein n=1 Tax=Vibrio fluvialis TaxID=676 RepID=UPI001F479963|nr:hypothetical protein [Vibrio fluvialis]MCE7638368.1 hypothetical protein [Vibrio fluvialis]MCG6405255.1 hypothetical protein [Vibrio fluvialis]
MLKIFLGVFLGVVLGGTVLVLGYEYYLNYKIEKSIEEVNAFEQKKLKEKEDDEQRIKEWFLEQNEKKCSREISKRHPGAINIELVHNTSLLTAMNFTLDGVSHHVRCYFDDSSAFKRFEKVR